MFDRAWLAEAGIREETKRWLEENMFAPSYVDFVKLLK
jgi:hypothetical protein